MTKFKKELLCKYRFCTYKIEFTTPKPLAYSCKIEQVQGGAKVSYGYRKEIRLSKKELEKIKRKAKESKLNVSEYIRQSALNGFVIVKDEKAKIDLIYELNKIGTNINQVTKLCNIVGSVSKEDLYKLEKYFEEILKLVRKKV